MDLNFVQFFLLIITGIFTGYINTLAGSGSFISLPVLIFLGLPAPIANGTNRIGIFFQNLISAASFYKSNVLPLKPALYLSIPALLGALVGAQIAVSIPENIMTHSVGIIMLMMLGFHFYKPKQWSKAQNAYKYKPFKWLIFFVFFLIGIYGGFIQAGVGIILLTALVLVGNFDLVRANAVKVFINLIFTPFAMFVFIINNQVDYKMGLFLAMGNMIGAYIGAKTAIKWGSTYIRWIVFFVVLFSAIKLLLF